MRDNEQTTNIEDRATQPMDDRGWVSQLKLKLQTLALTGPSWMKTGCAKNLQWPSLILSYSEIYNYNYILCIYWCSKAGLNSGFNLNSRRSNSKASWLQLWGEETTFLGELGIALSSENLQVCNSVFCNKFYHDNALTLNPPRDLQ